MVAKVNVASGTGERGTFEASSPSLGKLPPNLDHVGYTSSSTPKWILVRQKQSASCAAGCRLRGELLDVRLTSLQVGTESD